MKTSHTAPNGVSIDAHDKASATWAMGEHVKATDGDITRCEERTAHIWKLAQQALNEKMPANDELLSPTSYYAAMGYSGLEREATAVLHYKNGDVPKAKVLFRRWWKSAVADYEQRKASAANFKRDHPEVWLASQKRQMETLLKQADRYEEEAKNCREEAKAIGATLPANASPERVKELKSIMQQNHPDRGGDAALFRAAADELNTIRRT